MDYYLREVLGASEGAVVAHDRGDSVALTFAARVRAGETPSSSPTSCSATGTCSCRCRTSRSSSGWCSIRAPRLRSSRRRPPSSLPPAWARNVHSAAPAGGPGDRGPRRHLCRERRHRGAPRHDPVPGRAIRERAGVARCTRRIVRPDDAWSGACTTRSRRRGSPPTSGTPTSSTKPGANEFWLLPAANHYLQHDQPKEFVEVVSAALAGDIPDAPGPLSAEPGAPLLVDTSRAKMPSAKEVLAGT